MSANLSVVYQCLMANSTVVTSCRWIANSKTCSFVRWRQATTWTTTVELTS